MLKLGTAARVRWMGVGGQSCLAAALSGSLLSTPVLANEPQGGDGQPEEVDLPVPPPTDPVAIALSRLPLCGDTSGTEEDLASYFRDVSVEMLVLGIENASFRRTRLSQALHALAVIGTAQDLEYVLAAAQDISWAFLGDAVDDDADDAAVLHQQAQIAARIRADIVWAWGKRGDLPEQTLMDALWDVDLMVSSRAVYLALASESDATREEALEVCAINEQIAAQAGLCPSEEI